MERLQELRDRLQQLDPKITIAILVGVATINLLQILFRLDPEAAVPYDVTPPPETKPGWKGEMLKEPSIKVSFQARCWNGQLGNYRLTSIM